MLEEFVLDFLTLKFAKPNYHVVLIANFKKCTNKTLRQVGLQYLIVSDSMRFLCHTSGVARIYPRTYLVRFVTVLRYIC